MKKQSWKMFVLISLLLTMVPAMAAAHDMWLTVDKPVVGQPLHLIVGYGHAFPANEGTEADKLVPAYIVGPKGRVETRAGDQLDFTSVAPLTEGSYVVVSGRQAQYYTKTPDGSKDLPRNQTPGAIGCLRSAKYAKAIVNLGAAKGDVSAPVGQTLEIVPLANPAALKKGEDLPVLILFEGNPLSGAQLFATFSGFSTEGNTFAFAAKSDKEGKARIKLWHPGEWLVLVKHEVPFDDPTVCDKFAHAAALTVTLK